MCCILKNYRDRINNRAIFKIHRVEDPVNGEIKFRRNNRFPVTSFFIKGMSYVLVAAISGGIAGAYVANNKNTNIQSSNTALLESKSSSLNTNRSFNSVAAVAADVGQAIVGICNNNNGIFVEDSNYNTSGMIFKSDGYIVTNYDQVKGTSTHMVKLSSGKNAKPLSAKLVGYDSISDLAVLKIERKNLPTVIFADSSKVQVGDTAIALGDNNGEITSTVTEGIVSAFSRKSLTSNEYSGVLSSYNIILTDADINESNNGGPLCNSQGEVIGINQTSDYYKNGYALSIDEVQKIVDSIIKKGHVDRPAIGFYSESYISSDKKVKGVLIKNVVSGTGAEKAGIKINDIMIEFDSLKISSAYELNDIVERHGIGDVVPCKVIRDGKILNLKIVLSEAPVTEN